MSKQFNFNATQSEIDKRNKTQESRQNSGIPGIGNLKIKENEGQMVRFLTPFSLGLSLLTHTVKYGENQFSTYVCEKNFSTDAQAFCPVCQYEYDNKAQKLSNLREVKNFLVYSYSNAGKYYQAGDGTVKELKAVNVLTQGPGKDHAYWNALNQVSQLFGLSGVDIEIIRTGSGLQTAYSFNAKPVAMPPQQPGGPIMQSGSAFDWSRIPKEILDILPPIQPEPFIVDPFNQQHIQILNQWGDFYIKAGNYKSADEFTEPSAHQPVQQQFGGYQQQVNPYQQMQQPMMNPQMQPQMPMQQPPVYNPNPMTGQPVVQPQQAPVQQPYQQPQMPMQQPMMPQQFPQQPGTQPGNAWQ